MRLSGSTNGIETTEVVTESAATAAQRAICVAGYPGLREVSCGLQAGTLTLRGTVSNYHLKQVAQTLVRGCAVTIDNQIHVQRNIAHPVDHPTHRANVAGAIAKNAGRYGLDEVSVA